MTPLGPLDSAVVAVDESDDPGVLGNLPRSRPGRRSSKRGGASGAAKGPSQRSSSSRPAPSARAAAAKARHSKRSSSAGKATAPARSTPSRAGSAPPPERRSGDPVTQAVRLAAKVAETGVKIPVGILKRLSGR